MDARFVIEGDRVVGKYKTLTRAQEHFRELLGAAGWTAPEAPTLTPEEMLARDKENAARAEYQDFWTGARPKGAGRPGKTKRK